jgi:Rieske Fe-S protein
VLLGAGAVGAAGVLAACGDGEPPVATVQSGEPSGAATRGPADTGTGEPGGIPVDQIPVGGGVIDASRRVVVTQPVAGEFRAFDPTCTHEARLVTMVHNGLIECPCHGSQYRITDGSVARGPAPRALTRKTATVEDGVVVVS